MKKYIIITNLLLSFNLFAQVGINTDIPTRALDINGNFKLNKTEYKNNTDYNRVLVVNNQGEVDYWDKQHIIDGIGELIVETKKLYFSTTPDPDIQVPCGKFVLRFADGSRNPIPQIKLKTNTSGTAIYFNLITKTNNSGNGFGTSATFGSDKTMTLSNDFVSIDATYKLNQLDEIYLSYPGDNNLYRITYIARTMTQSTTTENSYTMLCEKF